MKLSLLPRLLLLLLVLGAAGCRKVESLGWPTDYPAALTQARAEKKRVLLNFTGSDWCGYCIKMNKETLSQSAFKEYGEKNLILVEVDFPRATQQPVAVREQNARLSKQFGVEGFPCFVVLSADGREIGRQSGYLPGGPAAFIAKLDGWR